MPRKSQTLLSDSTQLQQREEERKGILKPRRDHYMWGFETGEKIVGPKGLGNIYILGNVSMEKIQERNESLKLSLFS